MEWGGRGEGGLDENKSGSRMIHLHECVGGKKKGSREDNRKGVT